jgi:predicted CXXCH cytochrome family protein
MKMNRMLAVVIAGLMWIALPAMAQITASAHNLNGAPGVTMPDGRICVACHTPHNAINDEAPLWNHEVTGETFDPYDSGTMDATTGVPGGVSLMCLSCHDGVTALDSFGGDSGSVLMTGSAVLSTDLTNDHPISFTYDDALATADGQLHLPTTTLSGLPGGGDIDTDMLFGLGNDQMECASCHDVHNGPGVVSPLLVKANTASALCFTCHNK